MLIITWITYSTRTFIFTVCPSELIRCRNVNYFNNPGNAIADGAQVDDILSLDSDERLMYKRVPKDLCLPESNQDVHILNPQYCSFTLDDGTSIEAKSTFFESPFYVATQGSEDARLEIVTSGNCYPVSNNQNLDIRTGVPLVKWDSAKA